MFIPEEKIVSEYYYHSYDGCSIEYGDIVTFKKYDRYISEGDDDNLIQISTEDGYLSIHYEKDFTSMKKCRKKEIEKNK